MKTRLVLDVVLVANHGVSSTVKSGMSKLIFMLDMDKVYNHLIAFSFVLLGGYVFWAIMEVMIPFLYFFCRSFSVGYWFSSGLLLVLERFAWGDHLNFYLFCVWWYPVV